MFWCAWTQSASEPGSTVWASSTPLETAVYCMGVPLSVGLDQYLCPASRQLVGKIWSVLEHWTPLLGRLASFVCAGIRGGGADCFESWHIQCTLYIHCDNSDCCDKMTWIFPIVSLVTQEIFDSQIISAKEFAETRHSLGLAVYELLEGALSSTHGVILITLVLALAAAAAAAEAE